MGRGDFYYKLVCVSRRKLCQSLIPKNCFWIGLSTIKIEKIKIFQFIQLEYQETKKKLLDFGTKTSIAPPLSGFRAVKLPGFLRNASSYA